MEGHDIQLLNPGSLAVGMIELTTLLILHLSRNLYIILYSWVIEL